MKHSSYIIPAIDFYIYPFSKEVNTYDKLQEMMNTQISKRQFTLIPFGEVDGLTSEEVTKSLHIEKYFAIVAVSKIHKNCIQDDRNIKEVTYSFFDTVVFDKDLDKEMEIGQRMEQYIENNYNSFSNKCKRIASSFLEKYQYSGYEETKTKIKRIEQKRK